MPRVRVVNKEEDARAPALNGKILAAFEHEMLGTGSAGERRRSVRHEMLEHDHPAATVDYKDWYVFDGMQCLDLPDGLATQRDDPLNMPTPGTLKARSR